MQSLALITRARSSPAMTALLVRGLTFPLTTFATFAATTILIGHAGAVSYGHVMLVANLFALFPVTDLGIGAALVNLLASHASREEKLGGVVRAFRLIAVISGALIIAIAASGAVVDWAVVLGLPPDSDAFWTQAVQLSIGLFALSMPLAIGQRILLGLQKNHIVVLVSAVTSVVNLIAITAAAWLRVPVSTASLALPLGILVSNLVAFVLGVRALGVPARMLVAPPHRLPKPRLIGTAVPMLAVILLLSVVFELQRIILAHLSTATELAAYSLSIQFYTPLYSLISTAALSMWPLFSRARAEGSARSAYRSAVRLFLVLGVLGALAYVPLVMIASPLISHGQVRIAAPLAVATALLLLTQSVQQAPGMFLTLPRDLWFQAACLTALVIWTLPLEAVTAPQFGALSPIALITSGVLLCQLVPGMLRAPRRARHFDGIPKT